MVGPRHNPRPDPAVTISRERLDRGEIVRIGGVPCTRPRRALLDEMRRVRDRHEAVVAMDLMAAAQLVSIGQLEEYAEDHRAWRRASQVFRALAHASEHSRSPNETRTRLVWEVDAGSPGRS